MKKILLICTLLLLTVPTFSKNKVRIFSTIKGGNAVDIMTKAESFCNTVNVIDVSTSQSEKYSVHLTIIVIYNDDK